MDPSKLLSYCNLKTQVAMVNLSGAENLNLQKSRLLALDPWLFGYTCLVTMDDMVVSLDPFILKNYMTQTQVAKVFSREF